MIRRLTVRFCTAIVLAGVFGSSSFSAESTAGGAATRAVASITAKIAVKEDVPTQTVQLITDSAVALQSEEPYAELSIANPEIADISTISNTSIYLLGKRPGRTTLMMIADDGRIISVVDVRVTPDLSEFRARLAEILPDEEIDVFAAKDGIVLSGLVNEPDAIKRAVELASHYAPGRISNLMTVVAEDGQTIDLTEFEPRLRTLLPNEEIAIDFVQDGLILSGSVRSSGARDNAINLAERFAPGKVMSLLTVKKPEPQPPDSELIKQYMAEVLPAEDIRVHVLGGVLVLSGNASSSAAAQRAMEIATLLSEGAQLSNMISVDVNQSCTVRTRRAGEMVVTSIPCRQEAGLQSPSTGGLLSNNASVPLGMVDPGEADDLQPPNIRPMPRQGTRIAAN